MKKNLITMGEKIKELRIQKGYSQEQLAEKVGYKTRGAIAKIEKGVRDFPLDKLELIAKILNVTPEYLIGWEDPQPQPKEMPASLKRLIVDSDAFDDKEMTLVPLYGSASAGNGFINLDIAIDNYPIPTKDNVDGAYVVRVCGDSMNYGDNAIPNGAVALVYPYCGPVIELPRKVFVVTYGEETYIKQLFVNPKGFVTLHSFNPDYDDIFIKDVEELTLNGRVIKVYYEREF